MHVEIFMVIGYVLMSSAIGLFAAGAIAQLAMRKSDPPTYFIRFSFLIAFVLMVLGVVCTLLHLGNIGYFYGILTSFDSWLTRESWLIGIFSAVSLIAFIMVIRNKKAASTTALSVIGVIGLCLGCSLIFAMSMAYMSVHAIPAWNNLGVLVTNVAELAALGATIALVYVALKGRGESTSKLGSALIVASLCAVAFALFAFAAYLASLGVLPEFASVSTEMTSVLTGVKIVLLVLALVCLIYACAKRKTLSAGTLTALSVVVVLAVVSSDVISRVLHFALATHMPLVF